MNKQITMGLIIGNRGFLPDHLAKKGRQEMIPAVQRAGMQYAVGGPDESKYGCEETRSEAKAGAALFQSRRQPIDGVNVSLPIFGDEKAVAEPLLMATLNVPVLVQATPDTPDQLLIAIRRNSFCGKFSVCNNMKHYRIPYSLTCLHMASPDSDSFQADLQWFAGVCRVVKGWFVNTSATIMRIGPTMDGGRTHPN